MNSFVAVTLMGMSGSGKTYWAKKLTKVGFEHLFCVDDLIEEKLWPYLKKCGYHGIKEVAFWLGQPYEKNYQKRAKIYVECEKQVMQKILVDIKKGVVRKTVVDTTGSVIYTGDAVCRALKKLTKVIYFSLTEKSKEMMFEKYLVEPKPVIWGRIFKQRKNESNSEALRRCYRNLLEERRRLYQKYADIILNDEIIRKKNFTVEKFLEMIA